MTPIEAIISSILVIMVWSSLYRITWVFRIAENMIIGLYLAFTLVNGINVVQMRVWNPIFVQGNWITPIWIAVVFGLLSWTRFNKQTMFLSRWSLAFLAGIGTGITAGATMDAQIVKQIAIKAWDITNMWTNINQLIIIICTVTVLIYFSFTYGQKGIMKNVARIGRLLLMIGLGAVFGLMQMGNFAIPIGLLSDMSIAPGIYVLIIASIIIAIDILRRRAGIEFNLPTKKEN